MRTIGRKPVTNWIIQQLLVGLRKIVEIGFIFLHEPSFGLLAGGSERLDTMCRCKSPEQPPAPKRCLCSLLGFILPAIAGFPAIHYADTSPDVSALDSLPNDLPLLVGVRSTRGFQPILPPFWRP